MSPVRELSELGEGAFLHIPAQPTGEGLVLTHGAGGNCQSPLLVALASALSDVGIVVLRYDLPFRRLRSKGPPFPAHAANDRAGLRAAVSALKRQTSGPVFLGGHSYGGRQASILASEESDLAARLLLLSYPLHPPGKPAQLRTSHFPALRTPALFVHGTKDPFGTVDEMLGALAAIPVRPSLSVVEGAGHDLLRGRFDIPSLVISSIRYENSGKQ